MSFLRGQARPGWSAPSGSGGGSGGGNGRPRPRRPTERLDNGSAGRDALAMTENPYAIPVEDLVASARVPVAEQVVEQPDRRLVSDSPAGPGPYADGMAGDADGE